MFTQPRDPNNETCIEKIFISASQNKLLNFNNQRDDQDKREAYARSKTSLRNHLYSTFVLLPMTKHWQKLKYRNKISQNSYRSTLSDRFSKAKNNTPPHYTHVMIIARETLDLIIRLKDLPIVYHIDVILVTDTDHSPIQETTPFQDKLILLDHLQD